MRDSRFIYITTFCAVGEFNYLLLPRKPSIDIRLVISLFVYSVMCDGLNLWFEPLTRSMCFSVVNMSYVRRDFLNNSIFQPASMSRSLIKLYCIVLIYHEQFYRPEDVCIIQSWIRIDAHRCRMGSPKCLRLSLPAFRSVRFASSDETRSAWTMRFDLDNINAFSSVQRRWFKVFWCHVTTLYIIL